MYTTINHQQEFLEAQKAQKRLQLTSQIVINLTIPAKMNQKQFPYTYFPNSPEETWPNYPPQISSSSAKKSESFVSTRKSSGDSLETRSKFKTEICKYWMMQVDCPFQQMCYFAHGEEELRQKDTLPLKYKTKPCSKFQHDGYCPYGTRCQFIHNQSKHMVKYQEIMNKIGNDGSSYFELLDLKQKQKPRRLSFFQEECPQLTRQDEPVERPVSQTTNELDIFYIRTRHNSM